MAVEASARIILKGGNDALRALQGIQRATALGSREAKAQARAHEQAQREAIRQSQQRTKEELKGAASAERTAQRVAQAKERAERQVATAAQREAAVLDRLQQRQSARWQRLAQQSASKRIAEEARVSQAVQREAEKQAKARADAFKRAGGVLTSVAGGAVAGSLAAASTARGATGAKGVAERVQSANEFRETLVRVTGEAGMRDQREQVQGNIVAASTATGTDIGSLMGVLETAQSQFNDLPFFANNLTEIATIARASGADVSEFAKALGTMRSAFGLTEEQTIESAYLMKAAADKGAIGVKDFAGAFAASAGTFALNTKQTGTEGVRQFLGAAQGVGTGQFGAAESSTRMDQFVNALNKVDVQTKLKGIGIRNIKDRNGKVDIGSVIDQLGDNRKFQDASVRQEIFSDLQAREGVETLMAARAKVKAGQAGAVDFRSIAGASAQAGRDATAAGFSDLSQEGAFKQAQANADMQADTLLNLESFNSGLDLVTSAANTLEKAFGSLSLWAGSIAAAGAGTVATMAAQKLLGPGAAVAGSAGGSALAGLGALTKKGAAGAIGLLGGGVAGAVGAGAALGYGASLAGDAVTSHYRDDKKGMGDAVGSWLFDMFNGGGQAREKIGGQIVTKLDPEGNALQKEVVQVLKQIDSGLRAVQEKPQAGGAREPR